MAQVFEFHGKITLDDDCQITDDTDVDNLAQDISDNILLVDDVDEVEIESIKEVITEKKEGE